MTEENFFISPLEELVQEWLELPLSEEERLVVAYRWGADQQLEACCKYIGEVGAWFADPEYRLRELRAARRPKPPSQADLAQDALKNINGYAVQQMRGNVGCVAYRGLMRDVEVISNALNRLNELEQSTNHHV
jgi:hypothetical protein